jgi:hypothetical protein
VVTSCGRLCLFNKEDQPQRIPRRPGRRCQRGGPWHLVGQFYGLRSRLY